MMGDLPKEKIMEGGPIVIGDLPRKKWKAVSL
jgi:hypothetical protein